MALNSPLGVILVGGQSRRMGKDKAFLQRTDRTLWCEYIASLFEQVQIPYVFSGRKEQQKFCKKHFPKIAFVEDSEDSAYKGPLLGLTSVWEKYVDKSLLVVPVDMQKLTSSPFYQLLEMQNSTRDKMGIIFRGKRIQPFPGLYFPSFYKFILQNRENSITKLIEAGYFAYIPIKDSHMENFANWNSPEDVEF